MTLTLLVEKIFQNGLKFLRFLFYYRITRKMLPESLPPQSPSTRRFCRLKQLKKILPSDRISIEKNFPIFYEKCKSLRVSRESKLQDVVTHQVQDMRMGLNTESNKNAKNKSYRNKYLENYRQKSQSNGMCCDINQERLCSKESSSKTNFDEPRLQKQSQENLTDRFVDISMKRGYWLQATTAINGFASIPKVVFGHRKSNKLPKSRAQLALEVMEEFQRQKSQQILLHPFYVRNNTCPDNSILTCSLSKKNLSIFYKTINLHTRRVS